MIRIPTEQRAAAMPSAAPVVPVMSGLVYGRDWLGEPDRPVLGHPRHQWLHGQAFHPAPRETLDIDDVEIDPEAAGKPRRPFWFSGFEQAATHDDTHSEQIHDDAATRTNSDACDLRTPDP